MKLFRCTRCMTLISIADFSYTCRCGHSWAKKLQGTKTIQVQGPCEVYALQDKELKEGGGKYWRIREPNKDIRRLKSPADSIRDAADHRDKQARLKRKAARNAEA